MTLKKYQAGCLFNKPVPTGNPQQPETTGLGIVVEHLNPGFALHEAVCMFTRVAIQHSAVILKFEFKEIENSNIILPTAPGSPFGRG